MYGASYHAARGASGAKLNVAATSSGVAFFSEDWKQLSRYHSCLSLANILVLNFFLNLFFFGILTLLAGRQEEHSTCNKCSD